MSFKSMVCIVAIGKNKNLLHGIGIKNVRKVVSDLNGQIDISYTDDTFHVGILLPNYE